MNTKTIFGHLKLFVFLAMTSIMLLSCSKEEPETGTVIIQRSFNETLNGLSIYSIQWGIFDPSIINESLADPDLALYKGTITVDELKFGDLLPGNYIVAIVNTSEYRAVQVQAGETRTMSASDWK